MRLGSRPRGSGNQQLRCALFFGLCPEIYLEKAVTDRGFAPSERLPVAQRLGDTSLVFLVHPTLGSAHMDRTCDVLSDVMHEAVAAGS